MNFDDGEPSNAAIRWVYLWSFNINISGLFGHYFMESIFRQVCLADLILLNKTDLATEETLEKTKGLIQ